MSQCQRLTKISFDHGLHRKLPGSLQRRLQARLASGLPGVLLGVLLCFMPGGPVSAEDAMSRVGFVDIPYLIERAPQALEAEQRLETEFAPRQEELEIQRAQLAELTEKLADTSLELPEAELAQLDRESRGLERRIKRSEQDFREELNIRKNDEFKKVRILVLEAIAKFGEEQDYDLIVSDGVLYANKRIDVTERILDSLVLEYNRLQSAN